MKKGLLWLNIVLFLAVGNVLYAQTTGSLDEAIKAGAEEIEARLPRGTKIVVLNFRSPSQRFSNYCLDEMMTALVKNGKFTVVDRTNLELIQQEMNFQMSGEVSDNSAQAIGQKLGAQSIVSGNIEDMGANYRIRFRTIEVESAAIQVLSSFNVQKDTLITTLMSSNPVTTSITQYPNGLNFSTGRKVGTGFLNMLFGIGSFTMGDPLGGTIVGGLELTGTIVLLAGIVRYEKARTTTHSSNSSAEFWAEIEASQTIMGIGMGVYVVGAITGFVRPFAYDKALAKKRGTYISADVSNPLYHISLQPVYNKDTAGMSLLYSMSY